MEQKLGRKLLSFLLTLVMVVGLMPGMSLTVNAAVPFNLTLNVGENGKVVMSSGIYGNGEESLLELTSDMDNKGKMNVADGRCIKVHEGANVNILNPGKISFYPAVDNTGTITAVPADGYAFAGWYNGETLYSRVAELDYKNISEDLTLTAQFASTALTPVVNDFTYSAPSDLTYNGTAKTATVVPKEGVTGMGQVTVKYYSNPECTAELVGSPTDVGTYYVGITVEEGTSYSAVSDVLHDASWQFTINKADQLVSPPTGGTDLTYNGKPLSLLKSGCLISTGNNEGVKYKIGENGEWSSNEPYAENAGTYTVHYMVEGNENYNEYIGTPIEVTIARAQQEVNAPEGGSDLVYKDYSQQLLKNPAMVVKGNKLGQIEYRVNDDGTWSSMLPSAENAGTYTVYYRVPGNNNYEAYESNITVSLAKADPQAPEGLTATYGQMLEDVTLPEGWIWANSATSVGNTGDNTFPADYTPKDATNYNAKSNVNLTVTVSKADPVANAPTPTATYGQTLADVTLTNPTDNTPGTWAWVNDTTSVGDVGEHTFKANFTPTGTDADNYNSKNDVDVTVTVSKADQTAPAAPTMASASTNSVTLNTITNGEYSKDGTTWQTSPTFTGLTMNTEYTFYQRLAADANHNASPASASTSISTSNHTHSWSYAASGATITATCNAEGCDLTDNKTTLTIVKPAKTTYGDANSAEVTITDANNIKGSATVSYYAASKSGTAYTKTGDALGSAPTAAGDYVAEITVGSATASVGYTIGKAASSITTAPSTGWDTVIPTGKAVGTYYVWYKVAGDADHSDSAAACVEVTIGKAAGGEATAVTEADIVQILSNSVEIKGKAGQEYIIVPKDTTPDWSDPTKVQFVYGEGHNEITFHDLTPITEYDIYTRVAETENAAAGSAAAKMTVMTCLEEIGVTANDGLTGLVGATYTVETEPAATAENGLTFRWYYYDGPIEFGTTPDSVTEITGASDSAYTLTESDVGKYFGVKAFKNGNVVGAIWLDQPVRYGTVTYDAKGGTPTPDSVSNLKFGDKLTKPDDPTRSGYHFAGWYTEEEYWSKWSFDVDTVKWAETKLYAKWTAAPVYEITGVVKNSSDAAVSGATVTLAQGYKTLGQTTTNASGAFTFSGVESGTYNVIAKKETQTKTELVELTENQNLTVTMPETGRNSVLDNDNAGNYAATVGGLDKIAAEETVSGDSTVTITLTVTAEDFISDSKKAQFATEKAAIQTVAAGKTLECLDLTLQKVVTGTGAVTTNIGDSNTQLLTIIIPYAASGKQNVTVYRYHGTTAAVLTQNPASGAEGFVVGADSITLYAKSFSTYAIGYTTPTYSGGGSSGGSAGSTITVPVSGDSAGVSVSASVTGTTATVKAPTTAQLDKVIGESVKTGDVTIDVSGLNKDIATVSIPTETVKAIEKAVSDPDNDADALTVKLTDGSVTFDAAALAAIAQQAKGSTIQLNLDNIGESKLKAAQKTAIRDLDVQAVYDAYMTSNGQRISDFKGGKAAVTVSYTLKDGQTGRGVVVWYVADDGDKSEVPTAYSSKEVTFTVEHFSNYVIAYDAARAAACPKDDTCPISKFTDVDPTAWYHDGVHYVLENGVMSGYGNGKFGPGDTTSRAMMAQILWNMEGKPEVSYDLSFNDLEDSKWYLPAIRWAVSEKIMDGYGNGKFGPDDDMTREQLVTIVYRYAKYKGVDASVGEDTNILSYDDAFDVSEWAIPSMQWAVGSGAVGGKTASTLAPKDAATRAEIATIVMRYCTKIAE